MNKTAKKIGIFDSGFGGLNIMKHIVNLLTDHDFVYLGDTARVPYGNRSSEIVYEFTTQALRFFFEKQNCDLVVLACNTASSDALKRIQTEFLPEFYPSKKVLGVIIPACELAASSTKNNKVGVIATQGTVNSGAFVRELANLNSEILVTQVACPLLVPVIEAGEDLNSELLNVLLKKYLSEFKNQKIDTLILGCTHYGIILEQIKLFLGNEVNVVAEGPIVAEKLKDYLNRHPEIEQQLGKNSNLQFFTTDLTLGFKNLGSRFFGQEIEPTKITLG